MGNLDKIRKTVASINKVEDTIQSSFQISLMEALALDFIKNYEDVTPGAVAEAISVSLSRMSRILSQVEEKGFVIRSISPTDRRCMIFKLTAKGTKKIADVLASEEL